MNDILNPDQIAALFEAAKSGNVPEASTSSNRRQQRMRSVDFSRPTKFTADHQRRITRATDGFCLGAGARLTAELRSPVEFETLNTSQVTWAAAQTLLPSHSLIVTLMVEPLGTRAMLSIESQFVLTAIEGLLGGATGKAAKPRRFSEIDWMLSRRLVDSIVHQLSLAWHDLGSISFSVEDIDQQSDAASIASVSEPTFVIMLEARMNVHSAAMALLVPWVAIAPVSDLIAGRDPVVAGEHSDSGISGALSQAPVTVRAEVASLDLPVADILGLSAGSVIRLGARADDGISVFAENVKLFRGQPGANGVRRAVQIRAVEEPED
jgi:flagellar motor switch protein FliM